MTYAIVGIVFGSLGLLINQSGSLIFGLSLSTIQRAATWFAGGLMIGIGLIALARHLGWRIPLPSFAVKAMFGEMGDSLLLQGSRVLPEQAQQLGYEFLHPTLESALRAELG